MRRAHFFLSIHNFHVPVVADRADQQVVHTVLIDVTRWRRGEESHAKSATVNRKSLVEGIKALQIEISRESDGGAEDNVHDAGIAARRGDWRITPACSDRNVRKAIVVDIADTGQISPKVVVVIGADEAHAHAARGERGEVRGGQGSGRAEKSDALHQHRSWSHRLQQDRRSNRS